MKSIKTIIRLGAPPYDTKAARGYSPFTIYGERFAVTKAYPIGAMWRATHVETGIAIPDVWENRRADVPKSATKLVHAKGSSAFFRALRKAKAIISNPLPS